VQTKSKVLFPQFVRRLLLGAGVLGVCFLFVAWFLVPGTASLNRLLLSGLFASLATNVSLLSRMFYKKGYDKGVGTRESIFRTPVIILGAILPVFAIATVTAPVWANNSHLSGNATNSRELEAPPIASSNSQAVEVLRVWAAPGQPQQLTLRTTWKDAGAWGLLLADVARHAANAYANEGQNKAEVLSRIRRLLDAEFSRPTDNPTEIK
jgi:hypothetical protein